MKLKSSFLAWCSIDSISLLELSVKKPIYRGCEVLTWINGRLWEADEDDEEEEEDEVEEEVDPNTEPFHCTRVVKSNTGVIVNKIDICLPKPVLLFKAPYHSCSSY